MTAISFSFLLALLAVATTALPSQMFPEHMRHGSAFADAVKAEAVHRRTVGLNEPNRTVNWYTQQVNHQDPSQGTFKQRWFVDNSHYNNSGLAMLYIAGEGPVDQSMTGYVQEYAYKAGALLVTLEHRWYGQSLPQPVTIANMMKTLQLDQAMQDFVAFADYVDAEVTPKKNTWVLAGGSYSGALVAWMKQKYPTRWAASWSSSGVVDAIFNFYQYDGHIASVMSQECADYIRNIFALAKRDFEAGGAKRDKVINLFGGPTLMDVQSGVQNVYSGMVQYSRRTAFCNTILVPSADPLVQYANAALQMFGPRAAESSRTIARKHYRGMQAALPKDAIHAKSLPPAVVTQYSWMWQVCSTFAWWQIGYPRGLAPTDMSTDMFTAECREIFTPTVLPDVWAFNKAHNGYLPNATHVIALVGSDDPWGPSQVQQSRPPLYPRVLAQCTDCGHCGDMDAPSPSDSQSKRDQRQAIATNLDKWIAQAMGH